MIVITLQIVIVHNKINYRKIHRYDVRSSKDDHCKNSYHKKYFFKIVIVKIIVVATVTVKNNFTK